MKSYILKCFFIFALAGSISSCEKLVEVPPPINELVSTSVFTNDPSATSAVSGIYASLVYGKFVSTGFSFNDMSGIMTDELTSHFDSPENMEFANSSLTTRNGAVLAFWSSAYNIIYQANSVIRGLDNNSLVSENTRKQLSGEALFLRAYSHLFLVSVFGDVPLVTTPDYLQNNMAERRSSQEVYGQIIADLKNAKTLLAVDYPSAERVRVNKWAASALLARAYLYNQLWEAAANEATEVITQSSMYELEQANLEDVFLSANKESIWQIKSDYGVPQESFFILFSAPSNFNVSLAKNLYDSFETGDKRRTAWIGIVSEGAEDWYYPYKYKRNWGGTRAENSVKLRLAETYLIRAEARAHLGDISGAQADIDAIRIRAGLLPTTASDEASLLLAVEQERRFELFAEDGYRWKDLVRTSRAVHVLQAFKGQAFQPHEVLLPIPFSEIQKNKKLTQNPGYN